MPLFHQPMARPLRLNRQSVKLSRLTDREIADVDHFLHLAFAFGEDCSSLYRQWLAELVFHFAQRIAKRATRLAPRRARRDARCCACFERVVTRVVVMV